MLFKNATVITMDPRRRIILNGAVAVRGSRIESVGKSKELSRKFSTDESVDLRGGLLLPGLIDSHVHLAEGLLRGCAENLSLVPWRVERVWPLQGSLEGDDGKISAEICPVLRCSSPERRPSWKRSWPLATASTGSWRSSAIPASVRAWPS